MLRRLLCILHVVHGLNDKPEDPRYPAAAHDDYQGMAMVPAMQPFEVCEKVYPKWSKERLLQVLFSHDPTRWLNYLKGGNDNTPTEFEPMAKGHCIPPSFMDLRLNRIPVYCIDNWRQQMPSYARLDPPFDSVKVKGYWAMACPKGTRAIYIPSKPKPKLTDEPKACFCYAEKSSTPLIVPKAQQRCLEKEVQSSNSQITATTAEDHGNRPVKHMKLRLLKRAPGSIVGASTKTFLVGSIAITPGLYSVCAPNDGIDDISLSVSVVPRSEDIKDEL